MCFILQAAKTRISFAFLTEDGSFTENIPNPVAYIPNLKALLISEPNENRIAIYDSKSFDFRSWFLHPCIKNGNRFKLPINFFKLQNGHFLIFEEDQINILNDNFAPYQPPIVGNFLPILKAKNDQIFVEHASQGPQKNELNKKPLPCKKSFKVLSNSRRRPHFKRLFQKVRGGVTGQLLLVI